MTLASYLNHGFWFDRLLWFNSLKVNDSRALFIPRGESETRRASSQRPLACVFVVGVLGLLTGPHSLPESYTEDIGRIDRISLKTVRNVVRLWDENIQEEDFSPVDFADHDLYKTDSVSSFWVGRVCLRRIHTNKYAIIDALVQNNTEIFNDQEERDFREIQDIVNQLPAELKASWTRALTGKYKHLISKCRLYNSDLLTEIQKHHKGLAKRMTMRHIHEIVDQSDKEDQQILTELVSHPETEEFIVAERIQRIRSIAKLAFYLSTVCGFMAFFFHPKSPSWEAYRDIYQGVAYVASKTWSLLF